MKKVTLSASEDLLNKGHERARAESTALNAAFQQWLKEYT